MKPLAVPNDFFQQLDAADKRNNLPPGTMRSIFTQETRGREAEFYTKPDQYHYPLNAQGQRIAGHTGNAQQVAHSRLVIDIEAKEME